MDDLVETEVDLGKEGILMLLDILLELKMVRHLGRIASQTFVVGQLTMGLMILLGIMLDPILFTKLGLMLLILDQLIYKDNSLIMHIQLSLDLLILLNGLHSEVRL